MNGLKELFKKKFAKIFGEKKSADEDDNKDDVGNISMNEGKVGKIFGINRKIVTGIVVFFGLVFLLAVIFAATDDNENAVAGVDEIKKATENDIADSDRVKNNLPNDYASFVAMNAQKNPQPNQQPQPQEKKSESVAQTQPQNVPVIPQNQYPEIILPQTQTVPKVETPEPVKMVEKVEKEKYSAPIAFSSFEGTEKKSDEATEETQKVSYKKLNPNGINTGTLISARLLTGINTDVSGTVTAQILSDVYNSAKNKILIPQGSKIFGEYVGDNVSNGRVPINFTKIILPDGGSLDVDKKMVAMDGAGYTGIKGKIHHHTAKKISAGVLGSAIAAMGSIGAGNSTGLNNNYSAGELAKQGAMANLMNVTSKMFDDAAKVGNTVTVEPGYEFQIFVKEDLDL